MIELRGVGAVAGDFTLRDASLAVPTGKYGVIVGTAGAGKTMLLETIAGIRPATSGTVLLGARDVTALPPEFRGVGMVYQHDYLFPHLDVAGNVGYGAASESAMREAANFAGVSGMLRRDVRTLSGGERQLVSLARALASEPNVLLLDEPFVALDPPRRSATRRMVRSLQRERGITVLHVTHDVAEGALLADIITVLDAGRVLQTGDAPAVFSRPATPRVAELLGAENVIAGTVVDARDGLVTLSAGTLTIVGVADQFQDGDTRTLGAVSDGSRLTQGEVVHAVIRADEIMVSRHAVASSARNSFGATVTAVGSIGASRRVELVAAGTPIVAVVTASSIADLALAPGATVTVTFKATAVHFC